MRSARTLTPATTRRVQRGIAALEFALLALLVMLPIFLGVFVFWEVLQTQQVVTRATGDGARQVSRLLNRPQQPKSDGTLPSQEEFLASAAALARDSVRASLRSHLGQGSAVDSRVSVALEAQGTNQLSLVVAYARPALLGRANGLNLIEPETIQARSLIQRP